MFSTMPSGPELAREVAPDLQPQQQQQQQVYMIQLTTVYAKSKLAEQYSSHA
jgi:hypothetical protein